MRWTKGWFRWGCGGGGVPPRAPPTSPEGEQSGPHPDRSGASGDAFPGKKNQLINGLNDFVNS